LISEKTAVEFMAMNPDTDGELEMIRTEKPVEAKPPTPEPQPQA
jgi:hypothetical protein